MNRIFSISILVVFITGLFTTSCGRKQSVHFFTGDETLQNIQAVVVLPLENLTLTPGAGSGIGDLLVTELHQLNRFRVMGKIEMTQLFLEKSIELPKLIDRSIAAEIGRQLGVDGVFIGSITEYVYRSDKSLDEEKEPAVGLTLRLVSSKTGTVLWGSSYSRSSYEVFTYEKDALTRVAIKSDPANVEFAGIR